MTRPEWIGLLARTAPEILAEIFAAVGPLPEPEWLRPPETGSVMVQGRAGGTGSAFNLGEVTATRCVLRYGGVEGHAFVQGRDVGHATRAAWIDALMQTDRSDDLRREILTPLARIEADQRDTRARVAEATRVDFETMVRGED